MGENEKNEHILGLTEPKAFHYVSCLQNAVDFSNPAASRGWFLWSLALFSTVWYPSLALEWTERLAPGTAGKCQAKPMPENEASIPKLVFYNHITGLGIWLYGRGFA